MKNAFVLLFLLAIAVGPVAAADDYSDAIGLIKQGVPCANLTQAQLERIGDYAMEQMHPGEAHTRMEAMMGGEGSESLRQAHVRLAMAAYCDADPYANAPVAGNGTAYGLGMMGRAGGMVGNVDGAYAAGYGMMGNPVRGQRGVDWSLAWGALRFAGLALAAFVVSAIFWGTYLLMVAKRKGK